MKESELNARYKYRAKGKRITIDFYPTELNLVDWIEKQPKKATYIKNLIKDDMERNGSR